VISIKEIELDFFLYYHPTIYMLKL